MDKKTNVQGKNKERARKEQGARIIMIKELSNRLQ